MGDYETGELVESITLKYQKLLVCVILFNSTVDCFNDREAGSREKARERKKGRNKLESGKVAVLLF